MKQANLFSCIVAAVLTFAAAACSSDEPNGGSQRLSGRKVAFSTKMSLDGNTKKIYLDPEGGGSSSINVLWGNNDQVTIYSTGGAGKPQQWGVYTVTPNGGGSTATLAWAGDDVDDAGAEIVWVDDSNSQSFYSVLGSSFYGTIDAFGSKTLTIPAIQTGVPANENRSSSYAVAFGEATNVNAGEDVTLTYTLVPGIIRLTIPEGDEINEVNFSNVGEPLSGTISNYTGMSNNVVTGGGNITVNKIINPGSTPGGGITTIDVYTLPKSFANLAITVIGPTGYCRKTVQATVGAGTVTDISFGNNYTLIPIPTFVMEVNNANTYQLANKWTGDVKYSVTTGSTTTSGALSNSGTVDIPLSQGDIVRVWESQPGVTFRSWANTGNPLIRLVNGSNPSDISLTSMPAMNCFTTDVLGTDAGNKFFFYFNCGGALTSLPAGSFDTSCITTAGDSFFSDFNSGGYLSSLPAGSFKMDNINGTVGISFLDYFNYYSNGTLSSLPAGSFNTSNITAAGDRYLANFNAGSKIEKGTGDPNDVTITNNTYTDAPLGGYWDTETNSSVWNVTVAANGGTFTFKGE